MPEFEEGLDWAQCLNCRKIYIPKNKDDTFCSDTCALAYKPKRKFHKASKHTGGKQTSLGMKAE